MSFVELRDFVDILRSLSYPEQVSIEGFRAADFPLVSRIAIWLVQSLDPNSSLAAEAADLSTEESRIALVRGLLQTVYSKCQIKLNGKKIYMADGHAVQELLKLAQVLHGASERSDPKNVPNEQPPNLTVDASELLSSQSDVMLKLGEIKKSRQLATEITQRGTNLVSLLGQEINLRQQRALGLTKQLELSQLERAISDAMREMKDKMHFIHSKIESVSSDEASLEAKIEKKKSELERNQKRLNALKSIRPAFMDEFEKLEQELIALYELYVTRMRCLAFLEQQQEEIEHAEQEKIAEREAQVRKMVEQMKQEELLRSQSETRDEEEDVTPDTSNVTDKVENGENGSDPNQAGNALRKQQRAVPTGRIRVFGAMAEKSDSLDSDLELGDDDEREDSDLDSEDELELMNLNKTSANGNSVKTAQNNAAPDSDNDF